MREWRRKGGRGRDTKDVIEKHKRCKQEYKKLCERRREENLR